MTKEELEKTHPHYQAFLPEWLFYVRSFLGGKFYRNGDYLLQHPFESAATYERRKAVAYYYNYCQPIIDIFSSYLFKRGPMRTYGALSPKAVPPRQPETLFDKFWWDCDFEKSSYDQFMRDAQKYAAVYGRVSIIVDKPRAVANTQADELAADIRPYLTLITPENLLDWSYVRTDTGKFVLDMVKVKEDVGLYRIWTRIGWELWQLKEGGKKDEEPKLIEAGAHELGEIPIVTLYNKRCSMRMIGVSDIQDIAGINKSIYAFCSDAKEIVENTAFPMLAMPYGKGSGENVVVGPKNIVQFDPEQPNSKPYWLEPPHSSLSEIREWVMQDAQEIARLAMMGGLRNVETSTQPWSGASITAQNQQLHSVLVEKSTNAEQAELDILRFYCKWGKTEFTGNVEYPREFDIKDLTLSIQNLMNARNAGIQSTTFEKESQKAIAKFALTGIDEALQSKIDKEIDAAKEEPREMTNGADGGHPTAGTGAQGINGEDAEDDGGAMQ